MFRWIFSYCLIIFLFSCKKKDAVPEETPIVYIDSASHIVAATKIEVNEFDISYLVKPNQNESYTKAYLQWSTTLDFSLNNDSVLIADFISSAVTGQKRLTGLQQNCSYYARLLFMYKNQQLYSPIFKWDTDSLRIMSFGYFGPPGLIKKDTTFIATNLPSVPNSALNSTKVFLGNFECPVISDQGQVIQFSVPYSVPVGKYKLQLQRKGIASFAEGSAEVLNGRWERIPSPVYPLNEAAATKGLFFFGTANSSQKGWIIGGALFNGFVTNPWTPESQNSGYIYQFDLATEQWSKLIPANRRYFENPICYYYNNSIYVIAALQIMWDQWGNYVRLPLQRIQRFDLSSLTWHEMDSVPYNKTYNLTSFEVNNEWYVGMGQRGDSLSTCCGEPLPSKTFFKYSPSTNNWTRLSDFPGGDQNFPTGFSVGLKGYVFYGAIPIGDRNITVDFKREFWEYNTALNSWQQIALPATDVLPPGEKYQIFTDNGRVYFVIGQVRKLFAAYYGFVPTFANLEWDPISGNYSKVGFITGGGSILHYLGKNNKKYYFHCDALGYFESIDNYTFRFTTE